jgi:hypothetical protein
VAEAQKQQSESFHHIPYLSTSPTTSTNTHYGSPYTQNIPYLKNNISKRQKARNKPQKAFRKTQPSTDWIRYNNKKGNQNQ